MVQCINTMKAHAKKLYFLLGVLVEAHVPVYFPQRHRIYFGSSFTYQFSREVK